jgi:hypothetical protein
MKVAFTAHLSINIIRLHLHSMAFQSPLLVGRHTVGLDSILGSTWVEKNQSTYNIIYIVQTGWYRCLSKRIFMKVSIFCLLKLMTPATQTDLTTSIIA